MADFHSRMMNIKIVTGIRSPADNFVQGHKEARHAAAEIALDADTEIERLRKSVVSLRAALSNSRESEEN